MDQRMGMSVGSYKGHSMIEQGKKCGFISGQIIDDLAEVVNKYQPNYTTARKPEA